MPYEIEQKFRCSDIAAVRDQLVAFGAAGGDFVDQADHYFNHPARDFAQTDEALRIRQVGPRNVITYKGAKIDATTKSRYEQETPLADGPAAAEACGDIFRRLGFVPVATVRKRRQTWKLTRDGLSVETALDEVAGVGSFVELEIAVAGDSPDVAQIDAAKAVLAALAGQLGLVQSERCSYLELLLPGDSAG
jgi:adenylate cyclase, class 2